MIDGYVTVTEMANKWRNTSRTVLIMCSGGKINGVTKFGRSWAIPADVEKPTNNRVTTGEYRNWKKRWKTETSCPYYWTSSDVELESRWENRAILVPIFDKNMCKNSIFKEVVRNLNVFIMKLSVF